MKFERSKRGCGSISIDGRASVTTLSCRVDDESLDEELRDYELLDDELVYEEPGDEESVV
jgi:hypothetical protein